MPKKVIKDLPLDEITLRRYEKPKNIRDRTLIKRICLSLGLLNPGESRDIIVDLVFTLIKSKKALTLTQIEKKLYKTRKMFKQDLQGITPSNISRQLRKLQKLNIVCSVNRTYSLCEKLTLKEIFEEKIKPLILEPTLKRIEEYLEEADNRFINKKRKNKQ